MNMYPKSLTKDTFIFIQRHPKSLVNVTAERQRQPKLKDKVVDASISSP